ncbi:MAG TPA: bifunctional UDP-N-acetylglucosamine diphosphorylase/glucosamine-1-phosphate N-acetyltransferase GlmU [Polyangiaceae bacterium LLY-WYZ-14_1]|nr:bifunctional UDP-N-acetylglucosamine diphosphorylase/glucosamine-1-phosphate N-acetyltransferase GlmU [Polyangiaceae bacterium LLY-WYZ-14_1]
MTGDPEETDAPGDGPSSGFVAMVLAAGLGKRMRSTRPKVLHPACGLPLAAWPIRAAQGAGAQEVIAVTGHGREAVEAALSERFPGFVRFAHQPEQRGTGHAVQCGMTALDGFPGTVVVLYGDCPLVPAEAVARLVAARGTAPLSLLVGQLDDPTGYGRILRDPETRSVVGIREHRDCSPDERALREVNPGLYAVDAAFLRDALSRLSSDNAQGELYLTDVVGMAAQAGGAVAVPWPMADLRGVNDRHELARAEAGLRARILEAHGRAGVTIRSPETTLVDADVVLDPDVVLEPGVVLRGKTRVGAGARIDVGCVLDDVDVAEGAFLKPYTVAAESRIGPAAQTGPFAHLRPATELGPDTRVGNFVETKKTRMGRGSKANHLAYLGDGVLGEDVNVGAGTIFCNYDGFRKHTTVLEDGAFIGSDSQLVAPVTVGRNAYVGTGTTVVRNVPEDALAIGRAKQDNKEGYGARLRRRFAAEKAREQASRAPAGNPPAAKDDPESALGNDPAAPAAPSADDDPERPD